MHVVVVVVGLDYVGDTYIQFGFNHHLLLPCLMPIIWLFVDAHLGGSRTVAALVPDL